MFLKNLHSFVGLLLLAMPLNSFAGGSVSFSDDILPLLKDSPAIVNPLLREMDISDMGIATRIGGRVCPGLAGRRVSPYIFNATEKDNRNAKIQVTINTNVDFFDSNGKLVFHIEDGVPGENFDDLVSAVSLHETFSSLVLKVLKPAEVKEPENASAK